MNDDRTQGEVGASVPASAVALPPETDASPAASVRGRGSNAIRCPRCGSDNASCIDDQRYHGHICHDCGYTGEAPPSGAYRVCFECGEVYETPEALVAAYNAAVDDLNRHIDARREHIPPAMHITHADEVTFCQECLHDF